MTGDVGSRIVHLGLGAFHRAHQAVYTADAADHEAWGITGVSPRSHEIVDAMRRQDCRYHVLSLHPEGTQARQLRVHDQVMTAALQPDAVRTQIADAHTHIVTLTITERGYTMTSDGRLDLAGQATARDLRQFASGTGAPTTALGHLAAGLCERAERGSGPIALLSCDNLHGNGHVLRRLVHAFLASTHSPQGPQLRTWIEGQVTFPSSMVDRIVPATQDVHRSEVSRLTGRKDQIPVVAEPFSTWVMEDDFPTGRPAWDTAGAVFSREVSAHEDVKLSLVNGTHSLVANLGLLAGLTTIDLALADVAIESVAHSYMNADVLPHLTLPEAIHGGAYVASVLERFRNGALGHRCAQVGSDGSTKLPQRFGPVVARATTAGHLPRHSALGVAAWLAVATDPRFDSTVTEPARAAIRDSRGRDVAARVAAYLRGAADMRPLAGNEAFLNEVVNLYTVLTTRGIDAAVADVS